MFKFWKKLNEDCVNFIIENVQANEYFVRYAQDNSKDKIHIIGFDYDFQGLSDVKTRKHFDLYFVPSTKEYSIKYDLMTFKTLDNIPELYNLCIKKLQDPAHWAKRINTLRARYRRTVAINQGNIAAIAMGAMSM